MKYHSALKSKTAQSLVVAAILGMAGLAHAQINSPGQGDSMQRPSDSMQPPVTPGKPFEKGTTRGEEAERKNRFDRNQEEAVREHRLDTNQDSGSGQGGGSGSGSGGY